MSIPDILIVDDEARICQSLESLLSGHGFRVFTANSGGAAQALFPDHTFDIALIDLFLPDISGQQLMKELLVQMPGITTIIMTGNASVATAVQTLKDGAYDYLRKPFESAELIHTINNALAQKKLEIENRYIQRQLEKSRRDYQYLVDNSPDVIYMLDPDGKFTFINPSIRQLTGLVPEKIIGCHYSTILEKNETEPGFWTFNERRTDKRTQKWTELDLITVDASGTKRQDTCHAELLSTGIYQRVNGASPRYMGTHGVIRDITEKKNLAKKKKKINDRLLRAEKMEIMGTLASGVAHDLNNLLSSIMGYPELILMDMASSDPLRDHILQIKKSGEAASVIVNDLLTLARRNVPALKIFSMDDTISDCLSSPEFFSIKSRFPNMICNISLKSRPRHLSGSPIHMSKCVLNLISNAAEAMPEGGELSVSTRVCTFEEKDQNPLAMPDGTYIKLVVADTGIGIGKKDIKKIFDPFYSSKEMGRSGTGLGMTIVWTTTKDHNGHIDIDSTPGKGTTISLYFPVTQKKKKTQPRLDINQIKGNNESILIIDDIPEQIMITSKIIQSLGYTPLEASSGEQGVELIKKTDIDLVIVDMALGMGMDGLETYKSIQEIKPDLKVIIISGQQETKRIKTALELGARQYIKKPFSIPVLGTALRRELSGSS